MKFSSNSLTTDSMRSSNESPTPSPNSNGATVKSFGIQNIYFSELNTPRGAYYKYILYKVNFLAFG